MNTNTQTIARLEAEFSEACATYDRIAPTATSPERESALRAENAAYIALLRARMAARAPAKPALRLVIDNG